MKRLLLSALTAFAASSAFGITFDDYFSPQTLRLDIKVETNRDTCIVDIDSISIWQGWYGRRVNLKKELQPASMQVIVVDANSRDTIYVYSKEPNVLAEPPRHKPVGIQMFIPKPKYDCEIIANIYGFTADGFGKCGSATAKLTTDQINDLKCFDGNITPHRLIRAASDPDRCINLAILAEGYKANEAEKFYKKAQMLDSALFTQQPPFKDNADRFNVVAVMIDSPESGLSIPSQSIAVNSALSAHFDSFGLERLVTLPDTRAMWDALAGIPAEHILILGNSDKYGGSGSLNEYAIATDGINSFEEVLIHEFGHSFGALGDEYEAGGYTDMYAPDVEPKEPNITTLYDFSDKWGDLIIRGEASLIEGAGYQSKGVWRGCQNCLMRAIEDHTFCPVCSQAISKVIDYYTVE